MLPVAIGGAIVRLGNLFNSEIVGAVTDVSWGFKFVRLYPNVPIDSIPVQHPTQLYEALCYLVISESFAGSITDVTWAGVVRA